MRPDPFAWQLHPDALAGIAALAAVYAAALRRFPASRGRLAAFGAAVLLLVATAVTPLDSLTFHLLTAHLLQNVVLAEWAPALLVAAVPPALAVELSRFGAWRALTHPLVALPLWLAVYFAWHLPPAYDTALRHPDTLLHLEHASYLAAGVLVWWAVLQDAPHALSHGVRAGYLFAAFVLASPIGLLLALLPDPIYAFYEGGFEPWGLSALEDQRLAGVTMAAEEAIVFFGLFVRSFFRFLAEEEADAPLPPPPAAGRKPA